MQETDAGKYICQVKKKTYLSGANIYLSGAKKTYLSGAKIYLFDAKIYLSGANI